MRRHVGTFAVGCLIKNHVDRNKSVRVAKMLVDTGGKATWVLRSLLQRTEVNTTATLEGFLVGTRSTTSRLSPGSKCYGRGGARPYLLWFRKCRCSVKPKKRRSLQMVNGQAV